MLDNTDTFVKIDNPALHEAFSIMGKIGVHPIISVMSVYLQTEVRL